MKFDDILNYLGDFGPYQKRLYVLLCLPAISIAFQALLPVFTLAIPAHRCAIPFLPNDTYAVQGLWHQELINQTIPTASKKWTECTIYTHDEVTGNKTEVECEDWVYDKSQYESTIMSDINLVCGRKFYRSFANMAMFGGSLAGSLGLGIVADVFGRKKTLLFSLAAHFGTAVGIAFIQDFPTFAALRFFNGVANSGTFMTGFVIALELVGPTKRTIAGMVIMMFWALGLFILGMAAYLIRDWRTLTLVTSSPSILFLSFWWLIPESPRWLLAHGREKEAEEIIRKAAKVNKVDLPDKLFDNSTLEKVQDGSILQLFTDCRLLIGTLIVFFNWFVVSLTYYGLGLNVGNLSGDSYLNFTIANIAETVSYILCILLLDRVGRKFLYCSAMLLGGVACILTMFPVIYGDDSHAWTITALSMIGKLGASGAFAIVYVYVAELFPTLVRNSVLGVSSMCARVGGIASPYIADLGLLVGGDFKVALPLIVFGGATLAAAFLCLYLPETFNRKLPETVEDAKTLFRYRGKKSESVYELKESEEKNTDKYTPDTLFDGRL